MDTTNQGHSQPSGALGLTRTIALGELSSRTAVRPAPLGWALRNFLSNRRKTAGQVAAASFTGKVFGFAPMTAQLNGRVFRPDWARIPAEKAVLLKVALQARVTLTAEQLVAAKAELARWPVDVRNLARFFGGDVTEYGVLSRRLVTDAGVAFIVDAFQNLTELEILKYHGFGTGTTNESAAQTALIAELTTEYATDNTRPTGTTTEGATANIYRTVATLSPDTGGTLAITEHGVFSQAANSGGTLLDRSKFSAVNLVAGSDSLQATYELTVASGG